MPCSDSGQDQFQNLLDYGVATTSANIASMVACEAVKLLETLDPALRMGSPMLRKWAAQHKREDKAK